MYTLRLPATLESLEKVRFFALKALQDMHFTGDMVPKAELVLEEVVTNIIKYAYPAGEGDVEVQCRLVNKDTFCFVICDWGNPFNPLEKNAPDLSTDLFERSIGGLGIFLVREMVDEIAYRYEEGKNILTICMRIKSEKA